MRSHDVRQRSTVSAEQSIAVEVVFACPDRQELVSLELSAGSTANEAVAASGLIESFADEDISSAPLAIWGRPVSAATVLKAGDRVEVLRPLEIDPRDARRELAREGQFMGTQVLSEEDVV